MTFTSGNRNLDVFQQFESRLVGILPMNDVVFITELSSKHLLPGDVEDLVRLEHKTSKDKAAIFINNVIKPSIIFDGGRSLDVLFAVMENCQYQHVKASAKQMRNSLGKRSANCTSASWVSGLLKISNSLQELIIEDNPIGDDAISLVTETTLCTRTLTKLTVQYCGFSVKGASCIGELLKVNISLQELIMEGNPINDDGMSLVVDALLWNTTLTKLNVFMCGFSVKGASCVGELLRVNNSLQELVMGRNPIGNDGMSSVADGLQCNRKLTMLNVRECRFSVKGAISISQALMVNQTLLELDMCGNDIKNEGITAIAESLNNSSISDLTVNECGITFTGVRSLASALSTNQNIKRLKLMNNSITVDGARLIMKSAVDNGVCEGVGIDIKYEADDQVKEMIAILNKREKQDTIDEGSHEDDGSSKEKLLETIDEGSHEDDGSFKEKLLETIDEGSHEDDGSSKEKLLEKLP